MFVERRKFKRLSILADVVFTKIGTCAEEKALTKDISTGGICFVTSEELKASDILELKISLPKENEKQIKPIGIIPLRIKEIFLTKKKNVFASGKVIWVKKLEIQNKSQEQKFDIGVEFIHISDSDKVAINKYVVNALD